MVFWFKVHVATGWKVIRKHELEGREALGHPGIT